jgi:hypothetical protein
MDTVDQNIRSTASLPVTIALPHSIVPLSTASTPSTPILLTEPAGPVPDICSRQARTRRPLPPIIQSIQRQREALQHRLREEGAVQVSLTAPTEELAANALWTWILDISRDDNEVTALPDSVDLQNFSLKNCLYGSLMTQV